MQAGPTLSLLYIYPSAGILFTELCILVHNSFCFLPRVIQCEEFPGSLEISELLFSMERGPGHPLGAHSSLESQGTQKFAVWSFSVSKLIKFNSWERSPRAERTTSKGAKLWGVPKTETFAVQKTKNPRANLNSEIGGRW